MKKKLIALLAVSVLAMTSAYAAETKCPASKWLGKTTTNVSKHEQNANAKINAKTRADQEKLAEKKAKVKNRAVEKNQKARLQEQRSKERKAKVEAKKKQLRELFQ